MSYSRPITFDRVIRVLGSLAVIAVLVWLVNELKDVLLPFGLACLISYLLEPLVEWQQRVLKLKHRGLPVLLTLIEATLALGVLAYFFIPSALNEIDQVDELIKASADKGRQSSLLPPELQEYLRNTLRSENLTQILAGSRLETILNKGTTVLTATVDFLMHTLEWLLTFIYVIFIMLDYKRIMRGFKAMVPPSYRRTVYKVGDDIARNMNIYFRSQAVIAACAAVFYCIGFSIVGLPMAIIMGIVVGVLYMIPALLHLFANRRGGFLDRTWQMRPGIRNQSMYLRLRAYPKDNGQNTGLESGHHTAVAVGVGFADGAGRHDYSLAADRTDDCLLQRICNKAGPLIKDVKNIYGKASSIQ